ncbi:hypothetical protein Agub_g830, partial [Astrephomene gubernaculifera]
MHPSYGLRCLQGVQYQARCRSLIARVLNSSSRQASKSSPEPHTPHLVNVSFKVQYRCPYGQRVALVGDVPPLGRWATGRCQRMRWGRGDYWSCSVALPAG